MTTTTQTPQTVKCNNCLWEGSEDSLKRFEDENGVSWGCHVCGTDKYIEEKQTPQERIAYIRGEIMAERISYGEIIELESLKEFVDPTDTLLAFWAGLDGTTD